MRVLADPAQARAQMDTLTGSDAAAIVRVLEPEGSAGRAPAGGRVRHRAAPAGGRRHAVARRPHGRAATARVELARLDSAKDAAQVRLPEPLLKEVREHVARVDREITDGYERQAVITFAGGVLGRAGLWADSDALLKANLAKSHSPYYLMSQLGGNARKQGRNDEALHWYAQAFDKSEGPATRLQWGSGYFSALVDLAPQDAARIEKTAAQLLAEAARDSGAFEGRSVRSLQRVGTKLTSWNADGKHAAVLRRLQTQLDGLCPKVDAAEGQRAACEALLKPAAEEGGEGGVSAGRRCRTRRAGAWRRCWSARRWPARCMRHRPRTPSAPAARPTAAATSPAAGCTPSRPTARPSTAPTSRTSTTSTRDAPKGGTLHLRNPDRRTSFDKYNPFTTRGNAPAGVLILMFEALAHLAPDEPLTMYGLLAEEMLRRARPVVGDASASSRRRASPTATR